MATFETNDDSAPNAASQFTQTHWSVVLSAAQSESTEADLALEKLCRNYWLPLYAYVRRKGHNSHDAQDLTQEFFSRLLKNKSFSGADPRKGRFRTYLLGALNHFLADEWDKARALKRGGGVVVVSLDDTQCVEHALAREEASEQTAEMTYDRRWSLTILERALARLKEDFVKAGKLRQFDLLKQFLTDAASSTEYDSVAAQLEMTSNHIAVSVHRMRQRYRAFVRDEIAQTVGTASEVDEELCALFR